ncbi:MAG: AMP-binding protein, partial [Desulfuromusa sp.]|nr:AMP-binding protein [Desulfuromusa sp.]
MSEVPFRSIPEMLMENVKIFASHAAVSYKKDGEYVALSYEEFYKQILMVARGLLKLGMEKGDRIAIFSENRLDWAIADFGTQLGLGVTVPIYATNTSEQAVYVINHAEAKIVFVSTHLQYEKLLTVRDRIPNVELVIAFDEFTDDKALPVYHLKHFTEFSLPLTKNETKEIEAGAAKTVSDDLLTIIYTSGTTGVPKGVMLSHSNMLSNAYYCNARLKLNAGTEIFLSFLPLSHVLERTGGYHSVFLIGGHVAFAESAETVVENIVEVRPTMMVSVPRLFEKIYSRIYENVHQLSPVKRKLFDWAFETGKEYVHRKYILGKSTGFLGVRYKVADRLVFRKIRNKFGGRLRGCISGGAPLDKKINEFLWIIGLPTFEGYGLTETSPVLTVNSLDKVKFGSVGTVLGRTEVKLAEDGELMARGPQVMLGYNKDPDATRETIKDGWLYTGDIAEIDKDGFVFIVDRKKEIIVTAGGKNIAPQPIENQLKLDKYISQAFVYGDRKPYLIALLTPNIEGLFDFVKE